MVCGGIEFMKIAKSVSMSLRQTIHGDMRDPKKNISFVYMQFSKSKLNC